MYNSYGLIENNVIRAFAMNKDESIQYLQKIRPFLNLTAICADYNKHNPSNYIDYNNLRIVLNGKSHTRLSSTKLDSLIKYLFTTLYQDIFETETLKVSFYNDTITSIVTENMDNTKSTLIKELQNEFSKQPK